MPKQTLVSVVIPTYNRSKLVTQAVESVLYQTIKNIEIIVVDDGSTDNTRDVLEPYGSALKYIFQENQGVSVARNVGVAISKGELIAFLDSDDLFVPEKIEKQLSAIHQYPDAALAYSNIAYCDANGSFIRNGSGYEMFLSGMIAEKVLLRKAMCGWPQTWLIRRSCFDRLGGFDPNFAMSEDRDFSVRAAFNYPLVGLSEALTLVRIHTVANRLGRSRAELREHYYFKFLDKLFTQYADRIEIQKNRHLLISDYLFLAGLNYLREEVIDSARRRFWTAFTLRPLKIKYFLFWFSTLFGRRIFHNANQVRKRIVNPIRYLH
jgi:glycosyltransferase involved in cell wall biosynthesis